MNIFLLEQVDARMISSEEAVFRDPYLTRLATQTLAICPLLPVHKEGDPMADSKFYQIYTDFLGLYDSMSLGHPVFSALLLPPVLDTKDFPVDFRRLLFVDYGHLLPTIEAPLPPNLDFSSMPGESSDTLLGSYLAGIVQKKITERRNPALWSFCLYHLKYAANDNKTWKDTIQREVGPEIWTLMKSN